MASNRCEKSCMPRGADMASEPRDTPHAEFLTALQELAVERDGDQFLYASASASAAGQLALGATASRPLASHTSDCVEIALMRQGSALIATPGRVVRLTPGRVFVIGYGVHHAELPGSFRLPHRTFWCHLFPDQVVLGDSTFDPKRGLVSPELLIPSPPHTDAVAQTICSELADRAWGCGRVVTALLAYLSSLLARRIRRGQILQRRVFQAPPPAGGEKAWMAVETVLAFCEANFRKGISRDDVARAVGYSPSYLGRLVSMHLGHSLTQHLNDLRMGEAKRLLENTDLSVRQIASHLGYEDPAHFTRAFTRATGDSPMAHRRSAGARRRTAGRPEAVSPEEG
jgi:AraC family transcriptional activator of pobA